MDPCLEVGDAKCWVIETITESIFLWIWSPFVFFPAFYSPLIVILLKLTKYFLRLWVKRIPFVAADRLHDMILSRYTIVLISAFFIFP